MLAVLFVVPFANVSALELQNELSVENSNEILIQKKLMIF